MGLVREWKWGVTDPFEIGDCVLEENEIVGYTCSDGWTEEAAL